MWVLLVVIVRGCVVFGIVDESFYDRLFLVVCWEVSYFVVVVVHDFCEVCHLCLVLVYGSGDGVVRGGGGPVYFGCV